MTDAPEKKSFRKELSAAQNEDGVLVRTHVGGQALIEGIMMRGKYNWACAVRTPDGGMHIEEHDLASGKDKNSWMYKPVIRGCTALVESLALGYKALDVSAEYAYDFSEEEAEAAAKKAEKEARKAARRAARKAEAASTEVAEEAETAAEPAPAGLPASVEAEAPKEAGGGLSGSETAIAMVLGVALAVALFIIVPAVLTNFIVGDYGGKGTFLWNLIDGLIRIAVFVFYIWLIGRMKDIKRLFRYHGAEHKTIHCFEHGLELTPENAAKFPTLHVRCGTAFLIMTLIIAILVFTLVPVGALIDAMGVTSRFWRLMLVILSRIVLLPLVAGLAYEVTVKWAGTRPENRLVRIVLWPGMQMQRLTTGEPDEGMLECAIAAMKLVLEREEREATDTVDA